MPDGASRVFFLSVDIAGSTAFKAMAGMGPDGRPNWIGAFETFLARFPDILVAQLGEEFLSCPRQPILRLWKALGDEVVFTLAEPANADLVGVVAALDRALIHFERTFWEEVPLRLKASTWIASFPRPNVEICIRNPAQPDLPGMIDFIGPEIDHGFRLSKFARSGAIVVSIALLQILLDNDDKEKLKFLSLGQESLKGINGGRPYPIIWVWSEDIKHRFFSLESEADKLVEKAASAEPTARMTLKEIIKNTQRLRKKLHGWLEGPL